MRIQYGYDPRLFDLSRIPTWDGFVQAWKISLLKPSTTACPTAGPTAAVLSPIVHEYVLLLRKETPLVIPFLMTYRVNSDIRDMPGATWRDIIADILEDCNGRAPLEEIYRRVEGHKRAQSQQWWKEKGAADPADQSPNLRKGRSWHMVFS